MAQSPETIQADFDRIARFSTEGWNHNNHYHGFLTRYVPQHCADILEIGCGTGGFTRCLAMRADHVLAFDLSPQMIRTAQERSREWGNIEFQVVDAMTWEFPIEQYDCVASLATLHHLPLREMLVKIKATLKPGGVLIVLDLFKPEGVRDMFMGALALPAHWVLKLVKTGWRKGSIEERKAWAEHAKHDFPLTLSKIHRVCAEELPAAKTRKHLLWRYSIVWTKPEGTGSPPLS